MRNIHLFIIDPQNDFCQPANPGLADAMEAHIGHATSVSQSVRNGGSLCVPGADQDMERAAAMINRIFKKTTDIHVTLDSHRTVDIAHPIYWVNSHGQHPAPYTIISEDDVENGVWRTMNPAWQARSLTYVKTLAANKRYPLCIWPPHCIIGTWGHSVYPAVADALMRWENTFKLVDYVTKGSNVFTEHYSALQADVPDTEDETTNLNTDLIDILADQSVDEIIFLGEALSHCVANTGFDIANNFGEENIKKITLITDCCSNVPTFETLGENFVKEMVGRGMKTATSTEILA